MRVRVGCEMTYELGQATPMLAILTREQRKMCSRLSAGIINQTQQSWRLDRFLGSGLTHFVPNRLNRSTGGAIERQ